MLILMVRISIFVNFILLEEMVLAIFWMILGGFFFTFTIGNLSSMLSNLNTRESQISDKINVINQFAKQTTVDKFLRDRLKNAVVYITKKNFLWSDKREIFDELPA